MLVVALAAVPAAAGPCAHTERRQATLDATGATRLEIDARAGTLRVEGRAGATQVKASGTACAPSAGALEGVRLSATRDGATLRLEAQVPESSLPAGGDASLDLLVDVPRSLALNVTDTSGPIEIRHVGALTLEDGSGEITVEDVGGDLKLTDGSGEMTLTKVAGDAWVRDASGPLTMRDVGGSVTIEEDGSGGIEIAAVGGSVLVESDGSGEIDVRDVGGDFTVEHKGSGAVRHTGVKGRVSLPKGK
jgi:hypothetical protein